MCVCVCVGVCVCVCVCVCVFCLKVEKYKIFDYSTCAQYIFITLQTINICLFGVLVVLSVVVDMPDENVD